MLLPLRRMFERYETEKADSDVAAFYSLLYAGEHVIKLTVCGLLAGLQDDRDRHRYTQMRALVLFLRFFFSTHTFRAYTPSERHIVLCLLSLALP